MKKYIKNLLIILILIFAIYIIYKFSFLRFWRKYEFEKNTINLSQSYKNSPFEISKIIMYSSGYGENKNISFSQNNWILDILQYTDIAIYIDNNNEKLTSANSVKKLSLENIKISAPKLGFPALYYLDSLNFGTYKINQNYEIQNSLEFTVLNDSNEAGNIGSNTPVFFADCSNPITLKYVNSNIKENYKIESNEPLFFNGKLLEIANINLNDLMSSIDFSINIENFEGQKYSYHLSLPIEFENKNESIYDGSFLSRKNYKNLKFMKLGD